VAAELTWVIWRTALNRLDAFEKVKDAIWARDREVRAATLREAAGIFESQHWAAHELNRMATETDGIAVDGFPVGPLASRTAPLAVPPNHPEIPDSSRACEVCQGRGFELDGPDSDQIDCRACGGDPTGAEPGTGKR
jgi:hypothetical protein